MRIEKAKKEHFSAIWDIIQDGIESRKAEGSEQWQNGYPSKDIIYADIDAERGYISWEGDSISGYVVMSFGEDKTHYNDKTVWEHHEHYATLHRIAVSRHFQNRGIATRFFHEIEKLATEKECNSIKVVTNYDNTGIIRILDKLGYKNLGEINYFDNIRLAFEKTL